MSFPLSLEKVQQIPCKASASYLFNNLSFSGTHFAYVHQNEVYVTLDVTTLKKGSNNTKITAKENSQVTQAKWINSNKASASIKNVLVITTQSHFQVYDQDCSKALFTYTLLPATFDNIPPGKIKYCRGIASVLIQNKTYLLIGTSAGSILVFEFIQGKSKECCVYTQTLKAHSFPVCDISSDPATSQWASSDSNGNVMLWNEFESKASMSGGGFPCASVAINKHSLICAYGNGIVSVHDSTTGNKTADVAAHSRFIHAIDFHPTLNVFATVSEDTKLHLWEINTANSTVMMLRSTVVKDSLLCGVQFCGEGFSNVAVSAYDVSHVLVFTQ